MRSALDPDLRNGNSSHLPMVLAAMRALGGTAEQLDRFETHYAPLTQPLRAPASAFDPARHLGSAAHFTNWLQHYEHELAGTPWQSVLQRDLPRLMEGLASSAFHGMIRLAYGVRFDQRDETAAGLAMLSAFRVELPLPDGGRSTGAAEGLRSLAFDESLAGIVWHEPPIMRRLREVFRHPTFVAAVGPLRIEKGADRAWFSLLTSAARLHRATGEFAALHLVTGLHAMRVLWPWLGIREDALQRFWLAFCAVFVAIGRPWPFEWLDVGPLLPWRELRERACASDDDHLAKLVFSCEDLAAGMPDDPMLAATLQACATLEARRR